MQAYSIFTDDELLIHLQLGDELAFTEIYNRYWEKLLATGYYYTHDKHLSEDIVHEVMMSLWVRKTDLKIQSLNAFLAGAVKFAVFKAIARDKRHRELLAGNATPEHFSDIEEKLDARFMEEYLHGVVNELPEKAHLVFTYSRNEELSIIEIGRKMDLSPKAVEYHMTKALRKLTDALRKIKSFFI